MKSSLLTRSALLAGASTLVLTVAACSSSNSDADTEAATTASSTPGSAGAPGTEQAAAGEPFGPACEQLPASGPGSVEAMGEQPVATAAADNPVLSALVQAIGAAQLGESLDTASEITVLAPANTAFDAVPAETLNGLLADVPELTQVLQHHIIGGRLAPDALAGEQTTLLGDLVTIEGSGADLTIPADQTLLGEADATVVCGDVQTANATVYIIDQVLEPAEG